MFIEHLLCTRHHSRPWDYKSKQNLDPSLRSLQFNENQTSMGALVESAMGPQREAFNILGV